MADTSWHSDAFPELRSGPPWVMQEMIAAQPALAEEMLGSPSPAASAIGAEIASALAAARPVTVTGCGTSEHAAVAVASLIAGAAAPERRALVRARPALSAALDAAGGVCLAVSHDGGTRATALALAAARAAGARTAAITHDASASVAAAADHVLTTPVHDASWCHTIAYTSALLAGAAIAGAVGPLSTDPATAGRLLRQAIELDPAPCRRAAGGQPRPDVRRGWTRSRHRPGARAQDRRRSPGNARPSRWSSRPCCTASSPDTSPATRSSSSPSTTAPSTTASPAARRTSPRPSPPSASRSPASCQPRITRRCPRSSRPPGASSSTSLIATLLARRLAAQLAGAGALQALTLALAHSRGVNPDLIRREEAPYRGAADVAEQDARLVRPASRPDPNKRVAHHGVLHSTRQVRCGCDRGPAEAIR